VLADAAEALALFSSREPDALELARSMVTPGVATLLAGRLPEASEEDRRAELIAILPKLGEEMALATLEALKEEALDGDADRATRRAYLAVVSAMADDGSDILVRMTEDANWRIVRNAIHLIGERGESDAADQLKRTASHSDPRVRKEALIALSKIGGEEAGVVAKVHLEDEDAGVRAQAARTVGVLKIELALRPLLALLENESDLDVSVEAIRSLGLLGDPAAVPALEKKATWSLFSRTKQQIRVAAYRALGAIGSPHAMELVEKAAKDRDDEVRHTAESILESRQD
jgi:HEAT repeat protein